MLYYEKVTKDNTSDWILFIHGLGGSSKTWKYQIEKFSKKYNLLLVDLAGHGNSKNIVSSSPYMPTDAAKSINEILVFENIEKIHIISLSLGTLVALEFIRLYSDKVSSVILAGGIINLNFTRKIVFHIADFITKYFPTTFAYNLFANIIMPSKKHEKSREIFVREAKKLNEKMFNLWVKSVGSSNERLKKYIKVLKNKKIPTLFISGKEDYMFLDGIKETCTKFKGFNIKLLKNCGHVCSIEKSELFNNLSINFLEKIPKKKYIKVNM
jgi:pimeloyl-ACP methyl ester carboxylesterase